MKDPRHSAVWRWRIAGLVLLYLLLTLGVATAAQPSQQPTPFLPGMQRTLAQLAQALPGAGLWPHVIDMRGSLGGVFSTPMAGLLVLAALAAGALSRANSIRDQLRKDAEIARDETSRERVRRGMR